MNWGIKIIIILVLIVVSTVSVGIYMVSKDTDTLEESSYYERGLNYEAIIEHKRNVLRDQAEPEISVKEQYIEVNFKDGPNQGNFLLKRPSDQSLDVNMPFKTTNQQYTLSRKGLEAGMWEVQLNWSCNEVEYFFEKQIYLK